MLNDVSVSMYSCVHCSVFIRSYCHLSVCTPTVLWIAFCHNGSISLCIDLLLFVCLCVFVSYCIFVVLLWARLGGPGGIEAWCQCHCQCQSYIYIVHSGISGRASMRWYASKMRTSEFSVLIFRTYLPSVLWHCWLRHLTRKMSSPI